LLTALQALHNLVEQEIPEAWKIRVGVELCEDTLGRLIGLKPT